MLVKCIREPRGDKGLEGFELGELYQLRPLPGKTKEYAVVLPDGVTCCMPQSVFNKHFRQIPLKEKGTRRWEEKRTLLRI